MDSLAQELLKELECPICMEYMLPPILQCINGNNICHSCKPTLEHCPVCRGTLADIRSRPMENLSNRITHPCKYRNSGCTAQCLVDFKEEHEKGCLSSPYKCPFSIFGLFASRQLKKIVKCDRERGYSFIWEEAVCDWVGQLPALQKRIKHRSTDHFIYDTHEDNLIRDEPKLEANYETRGCIFIFDQILFCFTKQMNNFLHVVLMFVGTKEQAKNYKYKVTIKKEDEEESMSACFKCLSYLEFQQRPLAFSDPHSAVFPITFWVNDMTLANGEKVLPYTLEVMKSTSLEKGITL